MLWTSFLLQKLKRGSNSVNAGDRVTVLAFCKFPHGPLSVYQVSLNYLQYFKRYAPDKSVTDGRKDGRTDGMNGRTDRRTVGRTKRQLYALPSGGIKIIGKYNFPYHFKKIILRY